MRERIEKELYIVEYAVEAMRRAGVEPKVSPIRGGLKFFAVMVADNKFHNCLLHISMNAVHMVKSLIALRILRALTRDGTDKFIRKRNGIFHNILLRIMTERTLFLTRS